MGEYENQRNPVQELEEHRTEVLQRSVDNFLASAPRWKFLRYARNPAEGDRALSVEEDNYEDIFVKKQPFYHPGRREVWYLVFGRKLEQDNSEWEIGD